MGDTVSQSFDNVESVPQGSILNVLCFALAISDTVTSVPDDVSCSLYVDDFILYLSRSIRRLISFRDSFLLIKSHTEPTLIAFGSR